LLRPGVAPFMARFRPKRNFFDNFMNFGSPYRARVAQSQLIGLLGENGRAQGSGPTGEYPHFNAVFALVHNTLYDRLCERFATVL
jgi:hypothetical protein